MGADREGSRAQGGLKTALIFSPSRKSRNSGLACGSQRPVTCLLDAVLAAVLITVLADALDRDHALAFRGIEHDHALGRAAGNADALDARADKLAPTRDQHDLVLVLNGRRGDDRPGLASYCHGDNPFAAAAGGTVFVGRRAFPVAALGDRKHELLRR